MTVTNWCIITGAPRSGKTKIIERLAYCGYRTCPEIARLLIDDYNSNDSIEKCDFSTPLFEDIIFRTKVTAETNFCKDETVFFDRSPIDSIAFARLYNRPYKEYVDKITLGYKKVFLMAHLDSYISDYATMENEQQSEKLTGLLIDAYQFFGYQLIKVPKMSIRDRVKFIEEMI